MTNSGGETDRGAAIRERFEALGISDREWHAKTGIAPTTLRHAMDNRPGTRPGTYAAIEANLSDMEAYNAGEPTAADSSRPNLIRIKVEGVYGAKALIVEGSPEDQGTLEAMVDRIMRNLRGDEPQEPTNS